MTGAGETIGPATLAILGGIVAVAQVLGRIASVAIERRIGPGAGGALSEGDKAFFRELVFAVREEFEAHRELLRSQRTSTDRANDLLVRLVSLTDAIERRGGGSC